MAEALVVGALVSGSISLVLNRLTSPELVNSAVSKKLNRKLVRKLENALSDANALVADAEQKQFGNELVRKWLDDLRDAVYTADDLLDRVQIKAQIRKKVRSRLPLLLDFSVRKMVTKIKDVVEIIEELQKRKDSLGLKEIPTGSSSWRPPSTSLERGTVYGRDDDKQALIKMIHDNNDHKLSVISIVGLGGVGKTTLAQCLYNNEDLMKGFDPKAWICVSENFDVVETTKNVLKGITSGNCNLDSFELLQQDLKKRLSEKKFFIVLDDVWSDDGDKWSGFITPFQNGRKGSILLLTTRSNKQNVGSIVQNYNSYPLEVLSHDYCWSIFADNASFPESNGNPELKKIGRIIVKKCDGLPLAAETLGRLCSKHDVERWNSILLSNIWEFSLKESKIIPALLISYYDLPAHLKRCFVYCSLYPKGHPFDKDELILLWMAEDLLRPPKIGETLEEAGRECFHDLVSRLFFKQVKYSDGEYFVMHDLMHDLATSLAGEFYRRLSEELGEKKEKRILTRHLSCDYPISENIYSSKKIESLKTFLFICNAQFLVREESTRLTCEILSKNKYLRVLSSDKLGVLPGSIDKWIQLRYLNLSQSDIKKLPDSLRKMCNLQTLKLRCCSKLTTLPDEISNLVNLRHLDIWGTPLKEMPKAMGRMKQLQILSNFVVGKHEDNGIQELGGLLNLHGSFEINKLENVVDIIQARSASIIEKIHIERLLLEWCSGVDMVSDSQTESDILHSLQPHNGLKELKIKGYKGTIFPNWIGNLCYNNMTRVSLVDCSNCLTLPSFGQLQSLKSLHIQGFDKLRRVGSEFYKNEDNHRYSPIETFPSLESLEFYNMPFWEEWYLPSSETLPQLRKLCISDCPMLKGDFLNNVFLRIISYLLHVSQVCKLKIREDHEGRSQEMLLHGDTLSITGCESVVDSAFNAMNNSCLKEIHISGCLSERYFLVNRLPEHLQKLTIKDCRKLEFPEQQKQQHGLIELQIENSCDSMTNLSLGAFPKLEVLKISGCSNLESVSMIEPPTALQLLSIYQCHKLVSFAEEGLVAPNLTHLTIRDCSELKALLRDNDTLLLSLHSLEIQCCPKICNLPEGSLLQNLKELSVGGCEQQLISLSWIGNLDDLTHLEVSGDGCESLRSYPVVGLLSCIPFLTTLKINGFDNLETLQCNQLLHLSSLQNLIIVSCPKLENMEGEKLPPSLLLLKIENCDLLGELCNNKHRQIWSKISHIPNIQVDGEQILW
ncbi:hypothetical protein PIB30_049492 [Stylosanthes scabra]|uniref:Disease resistance RPP13-like protein 1 n=1 Tax=Stylosanthes scabra TaxID=79078 RepID=A0ABU6SH98_9FABA|nr:hypothetical protein [Stylosanthes scabra]